MSNDNLSTCKKTKHYSDNGCYHYPNATFDLYNLDAIIQHQLLDEKRIRQRHQKETNFLSSMRPKKKPRLSGRTSPVLVVKFQEKHGTPKCTQLVALLDSGSSDTIMEERFAKKLRTKDSPNTKWETAAGSFSTTKRCQINMQLSQLSDSMTIRTNVHLTKQPLSPRYQMIIGRDVMKEMGIMLDFQNQLIHYEHVQVPMTDMDSLPELNEKVSSNNYGVGSSAKEVHSFNFATGIKEPPLAREAVNRVSQILDAKYAPVSPEQILNNSPHLSEKQKSGLRPILYKHVELFDGTLGKWKGIQHKLELKDPKAQPFACRPYPVPVKNKATLLLDPEFPNAADALDNVMSELHRQ